ncbi:RNA polymerase-associated protein RTF1-like protein [Smittium culicis]|uniref:RNA polymerase-associated protein RTF1-like protein n=1 Tax=Smittium culicis TaxID=133412 RepID=A0A1R1WZE3_9FUNG|nr:RNA polymerase-associated protein RTF1-like protein [Smittium culicis]
MDELEGEILALFGGSERDKDGGSKTSKLELRKRRKGKESDQGYSEEDSYINQDDFSKSNSRSSKKSNKDEKKSTENENSYVDDWDSDLMGDDEDRNRLNSLPEVERERILAERQEQRDILWERIELKRKLNEGMLNKSSKNDNASRDNYYSSSDSERNFKNKNSRSYSKRASSSQLQELRKRRREKSSNKKRSKYSESDSEDNSEKYSRYNDSRSLKTGNQFSSKAKSAPLEPLASLQELNMIRLSRDVIDKWIYTPLFDETVKGSLVRIRKTNKGGDDKYYIAEVIKVLNGSEPSYLLKRHYVDVRLMVIFDNQQMDIGIDLVSNGEFSESEYSMYSELVSSNSEAYRNYLSSSYVASKRKTIETKSNYIVSAKDIDYRVKMFQEAEQGASKAVINTYAAKFIAAKQYTSSYVSAQGLMGNPNLLGLSSKFMAARGSRLSNIAGIGGAATPSKAATLGTGSPMGLNSLSSANLAAQQSPAVIGGAGGASFADMASKSNQAQTHQPPGLQQQAQANKTIKTKVRLTDGYNSIMSAADFDYSFLD